jgi:hypothetical protein
LLINSAVPAAHGGISTKKSKRRLIFFSFLEQSLPCHHQKDGKLFLPRAIALGYLKDSAEFQAPEAGARCPLANILAIEPLMTKKPGPVEGAIFGIQVRHA